MNTAILERMVLPNLALEEIQRAAKVASGLGHSFLTDRLNDYTVLSRLHKIGIIPFTEDSVRAYMRRENRRFGNWNKEWFSTEVKNYTGPIPIMAIDMMKQVVDEFKEQEINPDRYRENAPKTMEKTSHINFAVHYLWKEERAVPRDVDPFLSVSVNRSKRFFIAVWDEPDFDVGV